MGGLEDCGKLSLSNPVNYTWFFSENSVARINDTPEDMLRIVSGPELWKILAL